MQSITLIATLALLLVPGAKADTCYRRFYGYYECDGSGLSTGARWGIGVGIVVGVFVLCALISYWRRKRIMAAWKQHTQNQQTQQQTDSLPYYQNNNQPTTYPSATSYAPPSTAYPIKQPQAAYQPDNAGTYQYGQYQNNNTETSGHDYEYQQAEENRRAEEEEARRNAGAGGDLPPPGYDTTSRPTESNGAYQPPVGPPPKNARHASGGIV